MIPKNVKRIPYGIADFEKIRYNNLYYVDKTKFIPILEFSSYYLFLIRPRRFGKSLDTEFCLELMKEWYDSYRFSKDADVRIFNSDMVLYFIREAVKSGALPDELIDQNIRIDYGKLRHLMLTDQKLNGNFSQLQRITETGETVCKVEPSFPLERLTDLENFISLLFYFGLLSFGGIRKGRPRTPHSQPHCGKTDVQLLP
ncbi:AAA family ATPase [Desulfococcaceae bacterium HSG8]|nr:AAA family ATPase [Desulfococcaceae bacterium HSG8]